MPKSRPRYGKEELDKLLLEFNLSTPLSELETRLGRPADGLVHKMLSLSKQDPDKWDPKKASGYRRQLRSRHIEREQGRELQRYHERGRKEYQRQYYQQNKDRIRELKRRWYYEKRGYRGYNDQHKAKEMVNLIGKIMNAGYDIRTPQFDDGRLIIPIQEEDIEMPFVEKDFMDVVKDALSRLPYDITIDSSYNDRSVVLSVGGSNIDGVRGRKFLQALKEIIEVQYAQHIK